MEYDKHFLPTHEKQAEKEHMATLDYLTLINAHIQNGDMKLAKDRTVDLLKSLEELSDLAAIKEQTHE